MKIFLVDLALYKMGGVERVISTLANRMVDKHDVEICSLYRHNQKPFYDYDKRVGLRYLIDLSNAKSSVSKSKAGFFFFRVLEKIHEQIFLNKKIEIFCRNHLMRCDAVIFGRTSSAVLFLPYMKEYRGRVVVRDAIHLYDTSASAKRCMKKYFPHLVNTFIVSSEESRELYRKFFGQNMVKIEKMYNPLGIIPKLGAPLNYKRIIGVGRYTHQKGFDNLLQAFAMVHVKHPEWRLSLIGEGEEYCHYMSICRKLGIINYVEFKKSTDIVEEYNQSGIFVMTSRHEGYANALVEAMACGLPAISYDWYVGVNDIIKDKENGIIVHLHDRERYFKTGFCDAIDVNNLAEAINKLIENRELRQKISQKAANIVESRNASKIVDQWIKIIEE